MMLLLICGNVAPNPGPTVSYPCGSKFEVKDSDKACCLCKKWVCVSCDPGINESAYDDMVLNPTSDMWFCSDCHHPELDP